MPTVSATTPRPWSAIRVLDGEGRWIATIDPATRERRDRQGVVVCRHGPPIVSRTKKESHHE